MKNKNTNGYKDNSLNKYKDSLIIDSNNITMNNVSKKLMAVELDKNSKIIGTKYMEPNNGEYNFPNAQNIMEIPQYKKGGQDKKYTQNDLDTYLAMYMNGGELPKYQTGSEFDCPEGDMECQKEKYRGFIDSGDMDSARNNPFFDEMDFSKEGRELKNQELQKNVYRGFVDSGDEQSARNNSWYSQEDFPQRPQIKPTQIPQEGLAPLGQPTEDQIKSINESINKEIEESINPEQRQGVQLTNNPNIQFFNQYQGVDIPTAATTLGTSIEAGDTLGTVASSLKLATGLGRNIAGGIGQQRQYGRQQEDFYKKIGEHGAPKAFQAGGPYNEDLLEYMSMMDIKNPKDKKVRDLTEEEVVEIQNSQNKDVHKAKEDGEVVFTNEGISELFGIKEEPNTSIKDLNYGKYKDVGYFNSKYNEITGEYDISPTKNNPANAQLYKDNLKYLQQMNPNVKIRIGRGHDSGYVPLSERKEFQKGGQYQGNEYRTGLDEEMLTDEQKQLLNSETEAGEYIQDPNTGNVAEIIGDKHSQGGEKMIMEQGERVLTDHTKLGAKNAKYIRDTYDLNVKAKNTYADTLDKLRSKSGLKKLITEEEGYIKQLEDQEKDGDETTQSINTKFLQEKLNEVKAKKEPIEVVRQAMFDDLYRIQEANKPQENQEEFQVGGRYKGEGSAIDTVPQGQTQNGQFFGNVNEQKYTETVKNNPWFDFTNFNPSNPEDVARFQTQYNRLSTKGTQVTVDGKFGEQTQTIKLPQEILNKIPTVPQGMKPINTGDPLDAITIGKVDMPTSMQQPDIQELIDSGASEEEVRQAMNVALLPNQYPMMPGSLEAVSKSTRSYERFDPSLIDPTIYLENLQRQKLQAERQTEGLPPQVRAAALANIESNMAKTSSDTMLKIDTQNVQSKNQAEMYNTRIGNREVDAGVQDRLNYEGRAMQSKAIYDNDLNNYFNKGMEVNQQNYKDINALNRMNATHDVQFDGQNYIKSSAPDFSKYYEMTQQLAKYQQEQEELEKNKKKSKK